MTVDPLETAELQAFVHVVEAGSVAGAARELNQPRATISRRLSRLEERLAVRLLHRTTRKQGLTDAGEELFRHARAILAAVADARAAIARRDDTPRGLLRISLPPADELFRGLIPAFLERFPDVQVEVEWSTRFVDLVAEGFDVAIRAGQSAIEPGLVSRRLGRLEVRAYASPAYLEAHGTPKHPDDLAAHQCLRGFDQGVRPLTHWRLRDGGRVRVQGRLVSNDIHTLAEAALQGLGIALLPDTFADRMCPEGTLISVLDDHLGGSGYLGVVYPEREFLPASVRAFVDFVVEWAELHDLV